MRTSNDAESTTKILYFLGQHENYDVEKDVIALNSDKEFAYFLLRVLNIHYPEQQKILHVIMHYCNCFYILEFDLPLFNTHEIVIDNFPFFPTIHKMLLEIGDSKISLDERSAIFSTLSAFVHECEIVGFDDIVKSANEALMDVTGNIIPREIAKKIPCNDCEISLQNRFRDSNKEKIEM